MAPFPAEFGFFDLVEDIYFFNYTVLHCVISQNRSCVNKHKIGNDMKTFFSKNQFIDYENVSNMPITIFHKKDGKSSISGVRSGDTLFCLILGTRIYSRMTHESNYAQVIQINVHVGINIRR